MKKQNSFVAVIIVILALLLLGGIFGSDKSDERYQNSPQFEKDRNNWVADHWDELNP